MGNVGGGGHRRRRNIDARGRTRLTRHIGTLIGINRDSQSLVVGVAAEEGRVHQHITGGVQLAHETVRDNKALLVESGAAFPVRGAQGFKGAGGSRESPRRGSCRPQKPRRHHPP